MNKKMDLKEKVQDYFSNEMLEERDLAILYEVTGY